MENDLIIKAEHLSKRIDSPGGTLTILDDISFSIKRAEALSIVGASGSGKSTLLGLLAGLDVPSAGRVLLQHTDLSTLDEDQRAALRAEHVGFVFQSFQLLHNLTALENVMLPVELAGRDDPRAQAAAELAAIGLEHRLHHYPNQLSGGEQQRVAIARAFVTRPKILFADEPTGNLDGNTGDTIGRTLFALQKEYGATLVIVTHDTSLTKNCDRVLTLHNGRLGDHGMKI